MQGLLGVALAKLNRHPEAQNHMARAVEGLTKLKAFSVVRHLRSHAVDIFNAADKSEFAKLWRHKERDAIAGLLETVRVLRHGEMPGKHDLRGIVNVIVSPNGKFVYTTGYKSPALCVFTRDVDSGDLVLVQMIDTVDVHDALGFAMNDESSLCVTCCRTGAHIALFQCDGNSGTLELSDRFDNYRDDVMLCSPVAATFSNDSEFLFVCDAAAVDPESGQKGAIITLKVVEGRKLEFAGVNFGRDNCLADVRCIALHPTSNHFCVVSSEGDALVSFRWNSGTGVTRIHQLIRDEHDVSGLAGAKSLTFSPDGRHAYVSAGRFRGDNAIGVYRVENDGRLSLVEEYIANEGELVDFDGGNKVLVSPNGEHVYVVATNSSNIVSFLRNVKSGKLEFLETVPKTSPYAAPAGIGMSPDGKFLYAGLQEADSLAIYRRLP